MSKKLRNRNGARIARLFRKHRCPPTDARACDLDQILADDKIYVSISDLPDPGYTACLMQPVPDIPPGILLAPNQNQGRIRFSIAHELGHFHIPTHEKITPCKDEDMSFRSGTREEQEWEANDFAAELLMPRRRFSEDAHSRSPAFREIIDLASEEMYDVSLTAAALRYIEVTKARCALVCATEGRISWVARSDSFFYRIPWKGDRLPEASIASCALDGERDAANPEEVDPYTWLEMEQKRPVEVFESTLSIPTLRQVLSLIWVIPE